MRLNRNNMENNVDLQPITQNMKPTLWVPCGNLSFVLLPRIQNFLGGDVVDGVGVTVKKA